MNLTKEQLEELSEFYWETDDFYQRTPEPFQTS